MNREMTMEKKMSDALWSALKEFSEPMREVAAPKHKKEWVGKFLLLKKEETGTGGLKPPKGQMVRIERRLNAMETQNSSLDVGHWGSVRILKCCWYCKICGAYHSGYMPERWIEEGYAVFVEKE